MSFLQNQTKSFLSEAQGAASRGYTQRRGLSPAPPAARPSPTPAVKRPHDEANRSTPTPALLPTINFSDKNIMTQVTGAVTWLREKANSTTHSSRFYPFRDILGYLNMHLLPPDDEQRLTLEHILQSHSKVEYTPPGTPLSEGDTAKKGLYRFRPTHNVRSSEDLLAVLQSPSISSAGIPLKELRDGWADAIPVINTLDDSGLILVTRNKKDNAPKRVWPNDPSLIHTIEPEFKDIWARIKPPQSTSKGELRTQLLEFGLTPTSTVKVKVKGEVKDKKRRTRRGGKVTNTHMAGILKNFEHLRK